MTIEQLLSFLPLFLTALIGGIPGIIAIRRQLKMEEVERSKAMREAEDISADIVSKYVDAAGNLQDFYTELMAEVKTQFDECKVLVSGMEKKIDALTEENKQLKERIRGLERGVKVLTKQILDLGQKPKYPEEE